MRKENSSGFSLVGILVGVGLLGILTAGMMQVFSNMALSQNYSKFRIQVDNFGEELRTQLGDKTICTATFNGIQMDPSVPLNFSTIKDGTGKSIYSVGTNYGDNSFVLFSLDLKSSAGTPWYIEDNVTSGTGRMTLTVSYKAVGPQSGPKDSFRTYVIETHRNLSTGKLIDCTALGKASGDGIWKYNAVDIYFSGGNVGIGTTAPTGTLSVDNSNHDASFCLNGSCASALTGGVNGFARFTSTTTWTVPSGITKVLVTLVAGGGGGGSTSNGGTGGATLFQGCAISATGGSGGGPGGNGSLGAGGGGGIASGGSMTINGAPGSPGYACLDTYCVGGGGSAAVGVPYGSGFGSGGGGGVNPNTAWPGGGGGAGGIAVGICQVNAGSVLTLSVGLGGTAGGAAMSGATAGQQGLILLQW